MPEVLEGRVNIFPNPNNGSFIIELNADSKVIITNTLENTGIDIEIIKDKVLRIKHKFLS